jgi:hypothetical protein
VGAENAVTTADLVFAVGRGFTKFGVRRLREHSSRPSEGESPVDLPEVFRFTKAQRGILHALKIDAPPGG